MDLSIQEKEEVEAIHKKKSKATARTIMRVIYVANTKKGKFNSGQVQNILSFMRPFTGRWNSVGIGNVVDPYDYPWQNLRGRRVPWRAEELFESYVEREGFHPHKSKIDWLDKFEDQFFWNYSMKHRKIFRMVYEIIFKSFEHTEPNTVSVLNTEEIATLYHFPGQVASVPNLPRVDSTKGMAPSNLPQ